MQKRKETAALPTNRVGKISHAFEENIKSFSPHVKVRKIFRKHLI